MDSGAQENIGFLYFVLGKFFQLVRDIAQVLADALPLFAKSVQSVVGCNLKAEVRGQIHRRNHGDADLKRVHFTLRCNGNAVAE